MRFAVDACVPQQLTDALRVLGAHVVAGAGRPAMPDDEVLRGALSRDRMLITSDKDFGDLVFRDGEAAVGIVLIRFDIVSEPLAMQTAERIMALPDGGRGAFTVLERSGHRSRAMPD